MLPERLTNSMNPAYAAWLDASNPAMPEGFQPTVAQLREAFAQQVVISNGPLDASLLVEDVDIAGRDGNTIRVRIYRHHDAAGSQPACCFIHGGGFMLGNLDTHEGVCNDLAMRTGRTVIAIDYRLAPEHPYPAALHDTVDVLEFLASNATRLQIVGDDLNLMADSAGASLALAAALTLRDSPAQPNRMALVYPGIGADMDRPSFVTNADVPGLTPELMRYFFLSYIGGEELPDPLAAPLTVDDLSGLPPIFIAVAGFDPLHDDGADLARRLEAIDSPVTLYTSPRLGHGYLWLRHQSTEASAAFTAIVDFLAGPPG